MQFSLPTTPTKTTVWDNYVPIVQTGRHYDVYITNEIAEPSEYSELIHTLNTAYKSDTFTLYINTPGGTLDSARAIIDSITRSQAKVHAHLTGTVASAGTLITMACDTLTVAPHTHFMIHNYSANGISGKGSEIKDYVKFSDAELNSTFREIYKGFLTEEEMKDVIDGKDMWLNQSNVLARWENKSRLSNLQD